MNARPKINIPLEALDKFLEALIFLCVIFLVGYTFWQYSSLTEIVPQHFDAEGNPDKFGNKNFVFVLPIIGLVLVTGFHWLQSKPHIFSYPTHITEDNAAPNYRLALRMLRIMQVIILFSFITITVDMIAYGKGTAPVFGPLILPLLLIAVTAVIIVYVRKQRKLK